MCAGDVCEGAIFERAERMCCVFRKSLFYVKRGSEDYVTKGMKMEGCKVFSAPRLISIGKGMRFSDGSDTVKEAPRGTTKRTPHLHSHQHAGEAGGRKRKVWDDFRSCEDKGCVAQCLGLVDLPSTKVEYDTPYGMIVLIFVLTLHGLDNVMCVLLEKRFFGREYVVFVDLGVDLVENAKALLIVQQKLRKALLVRRPGETLDDLVTDVNLTVRSLVVKADVDDAFRHGHERLRCFRCSRGGHL